MPRTAPRNHVSPSRGFLDDQIATVVELRDCAHAAYGRAAMLPELARQNDVRGVANLLAHLVVEEPNKLLDCLRAAEHWLGATQRVSVPLVKPANVPSACFGAHALLLDLATLTNSAAGATYHDSLLGNADKLFEKLALVWTRDGIPSWLLDLPADVFTHLASVVRDEADAAISRLTEQFYEVHHGTGAKIATDLLTTPQLAQLAGVKQESFNNMLCKTRKNAEASLHPPKPTTRGGGRRPSSYSYKMIRPWMRKNYPAREPFLPASFDDVARILEANTKVSGT